jgi:hypothetical protein
MANDKELEAEIEKQKIDEMVKAYLDNGGEVQVFEKYARSENVEYTVGWGKKRKKVVSK